MTKLHFPSAPPADWPDTQCKIAPPPRWSSADQARYEELSRRRTALSAQMRTRLDELIPNLNTFEVDAVTCVVLTNPLAMHQLLDEFTTREV